MREEISQVSFSVEKRDEEIYTPPKQSANTWFGEIQIPKEGTKGKFFVKLYPVKNKKMYSATQYFLEKNLMEACQKNPKHIEIFRSALEVE